MSKYIKLQLISIVVFLSVFGVMVSKDALSKNLNAHYEITWNSINLGEIFWGYSVNSESYYFEINLQSYGAVSKLFPFVGKYSSSGRIESGAFKPFKYYQSWKGKKKEKTIKIIFSNNKLDFFESVPPTTRVPKINFYELSNLIDPVSAVMQLLINNRSETIDRVFDGRRIYSISSTNKKDVKNKNIDGFNNLIQYNLVISNYQNIWKDHNKNNLKKFQAIIGEVDNGFFLPLFFIIKNKGLVFKINLLEHTIKN